MLWVQTRALRAAADKLVADYSHGMKKKAALAAAVIHRLGIVALAAAYAFTLGLAARYVEQHADKMCGELA